MEQRNGSSCHPVYGFDEEIAVFEKSKKRKIDHSGGQDGQFGSEKSPGRGAALKMIHQNSVGIIHKGGKQHQHNIYGLSPRVKNQASDEQNRIFPKNRIRL